MKRFFTYLICSLTFTMMIARSEASGKFDIYLCIGQSNMAGRATLTPAVMDTLVNVYLFNDRNFFEPAVNPLNRYSTIRKEIGMQKLGPAYSFARKVSEKSDCKIGLVVNARGGSSIKSWEKGASDYYYGEMLSRIREALKYGRLKAVLWHQGEADCRYPESYKIYICKLVEQLRADLNMPDLLFVAGEISRWNWTGHTEGTIPFNKMLRSLEDSIPRFKVVSSEGLKPLIDENDPHFDTDSQIILGERYAEKVLRYNRGK